METGNRREGKKRVERIILRARTAVLRRAFGKSSLFRWPVFGVVIGIVSGIVAGVMFYLLQWTSFFTQTYLAGYSPGQPGGEHIVPLTAGTPFRPWLLVLLPAIGGFLSGLIVYRWAPEAEGNGMEAFIDAFHNRQGAIRTPTPYIKGIASLLTIGTGGCAGREGPIAQISSGIASWMARVAGLSPRDRRLMLLVGCGAGLSAIFRAPLGGALTAVEILYREDLETKGIALCFFPSAVSYLVFTTFFGTRAIFAIPPMKPSTRCSCRSMVCSDCFAFLSSTFMSRFSTA
jgi:chloride channel protein, CIC family